MNIQVADLYNDLSETRSDDWRSCPPGLVVALLATAASAFLADRYGAPLTLMALLVGLSLNFLGSDQRLAAGLGFASRTLLRTGIVLVGVRVTVSQIVGLGPGAFFALVVIVGSVIVGTVMLARRLALGTAFGVLAGGAVAICGASAALAFATLLGERRVGLAQLTLVLVGISGASAAAMLAYPILAHLSGLSDNQAGFLLGASIHDVAQALGAGYAFSAAAGATATIVKLTRVALLAPALAVAALFFPPEPNAGKRPAALPWFVVGFFALTFVNSAGLIPPIAVRLGEQGASACLACAVAATAIRAPMSGLVGAGPRPLALIFAASLLAFGLSLGTALLLIRI